MSHFPDRLKMMDAHVRLNMGVYFDTFENIADLRIVTSQTIPDFYWNYAYNYNGQPFDDSQLNLVTSHLRSMGRGPAIWQPDNQLQPEGWAIGSQEAWMWLDASSWGQKESSFTMNSELIIKESSNPTEEMGLVFEDAYSSGGTEGDVGYFKLPKEYIDAYINAEPSGSTLLRQFAGYINGVCVCIGTAAVWNSIGGLYSVATHHNFRRRGFAKKLSHIATSWALQHGAVGVMLQTEADSPVEVMYFSLGYRRSHIGRLLIPKEQ